MPLAVGVFQAWRVSGGLINQGWYERGGVVEVAFLLLQAPIFLLLAGAQVLDRREGKRRLPLRWPRGRVTLVA